MAKGLAISVIGWGWILILSFCGVAATQERLEMGVSMVVGDEVRTIYDVERRIDLLVLLSGQELGSASRNDFFRSVQEQMVDELLRNIAARQAGLNVDEGRIEEGLQNVANNFDLSRAELDVFLQQRNLSLDILKGLLESELLWVLYRQEVLAKTIVVSDGEVEEEKKRLEEEGERQSLLRIGIPYGGDQKKAEAEEALWKMRQIRERLLEGSSFEVLAKNFSQDQYREEGGKMGWVLVKDLPMSQQPEVLNLKKGELSKVIVDDEELVLFRLEDRKSGSGLTIDSLRERLFLNRLGAKTKKRMMVLHNNTYVDIRR